MEFDSVIDLELVSEIVRVEDFDRVGEIELVKVFEGLQECV